MSVIRGFLDKADHLQRENSLNETLERYRPVKKRSNQPTNNIRDLIHAVKHSFSRSVNLILHRL